MCKPKLKAVADVIYNTTDWFTPEFVSGKTKIPVRDIVHIIRVYYSDDFEQKRVSRHTSYKKISD